MPALTVTADGQVIFPAGAGAYKASPVLVEGAVNAAAYVCNSPAARKVVFSACVSLGVCMGKGVPAHRVNMAENQRKTVIGMMRETRRNTISQPGKGK
ncbi:hypothetical protein [Lysobacter enzymogenes]|uniref:hypothetical protein n=1 Tax=Lysobacter enzymogenes TaxID=69 RepID=UPI000F4C0EAE|nr:hypothetical protein [Lysobacter enzymogenes]